MSVEAAITSTTELLASSLVQGTAVVLVTAAVVALLRRARPALLAAVWMVALVKFVVPVAPELPIAFGNLLGDVAAPTFEQAAAPTVAASASSLSVGDSGPQWPWLLTVLAALWAMGLGVTAYRRVAAHRRLGRRVLTLPPAERELLEAVRNAADAVGVRRLPTTRVDADASGAFLFGSLRPVLVMPTWPSAEGQRAMLLHELAHIRRRDPLWRLLQVVVISLFFFWPPVLWVSRQIDLLREQACDQWAVSTGEIKAGVFARLLVEVASRSRGMAQPALAMAPRPGHLERRVIHLMTRRQRPKLSAVMAGLVVCWSAVALAGAERDPSKILGQTLCATDPRIGEQILASYPEADADGDGSLSKEEVCAHQLRMQRKLVDEVVSTLPAEQLLRADGNGDGVLSDAELAGLKDRLVVTVRSTEEQQSQLLLQMESPLRSELTRQDFATVEASRFELATAEVSGAICEPGIGRCVEVEGPSDDSFLIIDVALKGDD